jgi:hypothetical protein
MSVLAHSPDALQALRAGSRIKAGTPPAASTHIEMIKRFAKFTGALFMLALVVAAVGAIKLAAYWPHFAH